MEDSLHSATVNALFNLSLVNAYLARVAYVGELK